MANVPFGILDEIDTAAAGIQREIGDIKPFSITHKDIHLAMDNVQEAVERISGAVSKIRKTADIFLEQGLIPKE